MINRLTGDLFNGIIKVLNNYLGQDIFCSDSDRQISFLIRMFRHRKNF